MIPLGTKEIDEVRDDELIYRVTSTRCTTSITSTMYTTIVPARPYTTEIVIDSTKFVEAAEKPIITDNEKAKLLKQQQLKEAKRKVLGPKKARWS